MNHLKLIAFVVAAAAFTVLPCLSKTAGHYAPGLAVICGIAFSVLWGNPLSGLTAKLTTHLLAVSIVLMGFGMDLFGVLRAGVNGLVYTFAGIVMGICLGRWLGKRLHLDDECTWLISVGTSICGGSAIAAAAPALKARAHSIAIASATVFTLNAVALLVFPFVGHRLGFSQAQFGFWSALAIHDTSSVVGATMQYGREALEVGTTIKLARALWIIPVTLFLSLCVAGHGLRKAEKGRRRFHVRVPWFIPGFLVAAALVALFPVLSGAGQVLKECATHLMVLTLFLIGANLSREKLRELGMKPVLMGIGLWIVLSTVWCVLIATNLVNAAAVVAAAV